VSHFLAGSNVVLMVVLVLASPPTFAAAPTGDSGVVRSEAFAKSDGSSYFAVSFPPVASLPSHDACDCIVLFDTSASQTETFRHQGLNVLNGLLKSLGDRDRVLLLAYDLNVVPVTKSFVAPRSSEMGLALNHLRMRTPQGGSDMAAVLTAIGDRFQDAPAGQHAVIIIGDGRSNANLNRLNLGSYVERLWKERVSISSFAVGPSRNILLLAALANETGGIVLMDQDKIAGAEAGQQLSHAIHEPIVWTTERMLPKSMSTVYPLRTPPFRTDRSTVLIGTGKVTADSLAQFKGESAGQLVGLSWTIKAAKANDDNAYLAQLVAFAKRDDGYSLPTLGRKGLVEARRILNSDVHNLGKFGLQSVSEGDLEQARQFVDEAVKRRGPSDTDSLALEDSPVGGRLHRQTIRIIPAAVHKSGDENAPLTTPSDGELLRSVENSERLVQQKVLTEATVAMNQSRDRMASDPARVLNDMKLLFDEVTRVGELTSEQRADLRSSISALMEQASQRRFEKEASEVAQEQSKAAARDRLRVLDSLTVKEERMQGLIDRFNALVDEGYRHGDQVTNESLRSARRDVADEFRQVAANPYGRQPVAATTAPRFADFSVASVENSAVREAAERSFMDTEHLVDISSIPFPDSPPIVYPDAAFWRKITKDRAKWASVDLSSNPAEEKIIKTLDDPNNQTSLDFQGTPLTDVLDYIHDRNPGIPSFQLDNAALKDAGIDPVTTLVTISVKDISLRSALKLILAPFNLTYIIKDEVPMVTTKEKADVTLITRAYYVGDLVVPIQNVGTDLGALGGGMGGMMGGGMMGGGMGGGMMGGGMGGGMMGGGGF
jgi:hypothetical protein